MDQPITRFEQDDERHWAAVLACGHRQHTRHSPPWINRPWVTSVEGRRSAIGRTLACRKCDEGAPPDPLSRDIEMIQPLQLELASGRIHAERRGAADGPLTICVHGLSANVRAFDAIAPLLPGQIVALDLRGRGRSPDSGPGTYGLDAHATDVLSVPTSSARRASITWDGPWVR